MERRLLEYFPLAGEGGAALRDGLAAFDEALPAGRRRGAASPPRRSAARRAYLRLLGAQRHARAAALLCRMKSLVLIAAYALPALRRAVGYDGAR